jgi:glycosyltransferase involved in cell wall biosynthesis
VFDYARYNEEILGNESVIMYAPKYNLSGNVGVGVDNDKMVVANIAKRFKLLTCDSSEEANSHAANYDLYYTLNSGKRQPPVITSTKTAIHAVFQYDDPHGDVYAYISEWLSDACYGDGDWYNPITHTAGKRTKHPFVPHIVDLPPIREGRREEIRRNLGISNDQFVFGRIGGYYTFDLSFTKEAVKRIVNSRNDIVFVFASTEKFYEHPNIHYLPPFFDQQLKTDYIDMCDAMIHAREMGESFGLAMMEFLFHNKPVLAWEDGVDKNHVRTLQPFDLLYDEDDVEQRMISLLDKPKMNYSQATVDYTPAKVMAKFEKVFLTC